ncbi:hypothetical protein DCCM_0335 [Desulfocucumis palustris]|uniref:Uncharacterized protein n=1 Tax=Desulfocucumis palustris TaxID=1898651 RepID=A0A2L2X896_9FIRM|nr:hypothetical protein DCCM_0335 [Desulfocucumis palustris]
MEYCGVLPRGENIRFCAGPLTGTNKVIFINHSLQWLFLFKCWKEN